MVVVLLLPGVKKCKCLVFQQNLRLILDCSTSFRIAIINFGLRLLIQKNPSISYLGKNPKTHFTQFVERQIFQT